MSCAPYCDGIIPDVVSDQQILCFACKTNYGGLVQCASQHTDIDKKQPCVACCLHGWIFRCKARLSQ